VDLVLVIRSGAREEPPGKSGTAELVASLLDRGAAGMTYQEIAHAIERVGASRYASADADSLTIGMHGLAPDAFLLLELLAKMALHPDFPAAEVAKARARALDRWAHVADYGDALANLAFQRRITSGTDYGRGGFLSAREFKGVDRDDLVAFQRKHFTPANAILAIVGRVDPQQFEKRTGELFGAWSGPEPVREHTVYSDRRVAGKGDLVLIDRPELSQAHIRVGFRAPLIGAKDHYPLTVANALFGEYFNSRLNSILRDRLGLTYAVSSSFSYAREFASFQISSATRSEAAGHLLNRILDLLAELKAGPIADQEVETAKEYLLGGFPLSTATLGAVAARWLSGQVFALGPEYLNEFLPKVSAVTRPAVARAVAEHFDVDVGHLTVVVAGDAAAIRKSFSREEAGRVRRLRIRTLETKDLL
jgi:zinc protease